MLRTRWLGRVAYRDALALQRALFTTRASDHLLLLEHPPTFTMGLRARPDHVLTPVDQLGAEIVQVDRGGDVTYHGPGQIVGYPILTVPGKRGGGMADTAAFVEAIEQLVIDALGDVGLAGCGRIPGLAGVWVDPQGRCGRPRKIAALGVKLTRGRSMHGFAVNVTEEPLSWFRHIVPCGLADMAVTSLASEGVSVPLREVVDALARRGEQAWGGAGHERADVVWRIDKADLAPFTRGEGPGARVGPDEHGARVRPDEHGARVRPDEHGADGTAVRLRSRLSDAGVAEGLTISTRKPDWLRAPLRTGPEYLRLKQVLRGLDLVTVCEEAGCPNIFDCWNDGTATFMINGERCTRACGFCLVDTAKPLPIDVGEADRVAEAVERLGLRFAVVTAVARDDLTDGGASGFVATIRAIRARVSGCGVEVLIPDCKGDTAALASIFDARPNVLNHNIETVARLQRAVRPSAGYARSLAVLGQAKAAGLTTKSSIIVGMGETDDEVGQTLADLAAVGVDIVTIGQYLRPTSHHLAVARWVPPATFDTFRVQGLALGLGHVEASPLTRSSYHARQAAASVG